ncbi:uncharacterized protein LOC128192469 isoform X6 [Crassostrea angulata]|uniref:uncharacterized protein LOC128192469 isoform X6 n=1 Tax=Magallana angulata TaxID=2784310 RepID=UPI0022B1D328|nr:uncharacterized protein LOC128192469 isoform X6 [Crassostrea angulata]
MMFKVIFQVAVVAITVGARSEVKARENSIDVVREPVATCSAISCDVTITVSSEYKVNEQWVIFKNHTAMRITEWNTEDHKYAASNTRKPPNCTSWCNFTITLEINKLTHKQDYGLYQLILRSFDDQGPKSKRVLNITVPTKQKDTLTSVQELSFSTIMVIAVAGTSITSIICLTVCLIIFCRGRKAQKKKRDNRKHRQSSLGVSTHLYDEVESVARNAYCELNEEAQKTSNHQYIQPIPEEAPMYKAPEIFSNTESPTNIRAKPPDTTNDAMGYLQPSVKFRPEMAMFNQLYEEANKPKPKKPLEPTYSNSQKMPKFPKKEEQPKSSEKLILKTDSEIGKSSEVVYAQPHQHPKSDVQKSFCNDSSNKTQHEPMYGNENRTPPLPVKVLKTTIIERKQSQRETSGTKSVTPNVPPKPVCRIIPNQLYDEREGMYNKKRQVIATYSNPVATKLPTKTCPNPKILSYPACTHINDNI